MLTELRIKNFAIIESLTLPLAQGFNVLSGETGAGKSIIVGALGLLLGERANADVIRTGADLAKRRADAERRADYLRHVVQEIGEAKLTEGEDARLEAEANRLENAEELRGLASGIAGALDGEDETVLRKLGEIARHLAALQ